MRLTCLSDFESTANSPVNLERLRFKKPESGLLEPFIQYSEMLNMISFDSVGDILDLTALNQKREKISWSKEGHHFFT